LTVLRWQPTVFDDYVKVVVDPARWMHAVARTADPETDPDVLTSLIRRSGEDDAGLLDSLPWPTSGSKVRLARYSAAALAAVDRALADASPSTLDTLVALADTWTGSVGGLIRAAVELDHQTPTRT
jgi:hypothetical protein